MNRILRDLELSGWDDLIEIPPEYKKRGRFLWDRFLPSHGYYRWRIYDTALSQIKSSVDGRRHHAIRRLYWILGKTNELNSLPVEKLKFPAERAWNAQQLTLVDPHSAAKELTKVLRLESHPTWRAWLATALYLCGDLTASLTEFDLALQDNPKLKAARTLRALIYTHLGHRDAALTDLDYSLRHHRAAGLWSLRAEQRWLNDQHDEAISDAHNAIDAHPENLDGFVRLLYSRAGTRAAGESASEREILINEARKAASDSKDSGWGAATLGALLGSGNLQLKPLSTAVERTPNRAWIWAFLGRALGDTRTSGKRKSNLTQAIHCLDQACRLSPHSGWMYCWRAELHKNNGDDGVALRDLNKGLKLDPDYRLGNVWRAEILEKMGHSLAALNDIEDSYHTLRRPSFIYRRSQINRTMGALEESLIDLSECIRVSSMYAFSYSSLPWLADIKRLSHEVIKLKKTNLYSIRKKIKLLPIGQPWKALLKAPCHIPAPPPPWKPDFTDLSESQSAHAQAFRGRLLLDSQHDSEAARIFSDITKKSPGLFVAHLWGAEVNIRSKDYRQAIKNLLIAIRLSPDSIMPRLWLGLVHCRTRKYKDAVNEWLIAARHDKSNAHLIGLWIRCMGVTKHEYREIAKRAAVELAELNFRIGSISKANRLLKKANGYFAHVLSGGAAVSIGDLDAARYHWDISVKKDPMSFVRQLPEILELLPHLRTEALALGHFYIAQAWGKLSQWENRVAALSVAMKLDARISDQYVRSSNKKNAYLPSELWRKSILASSRGYATKSLKFARIALAADPHAIQVREEGLDSLIARIALAAIARSKDNLDEALRLFNLVLSDNATCVPALVWRGELRLKMGDYKGALIDLCSARIQTIRDSDALTCYGRVLCSLKRCPEAIEILKKAQRLDVHSPWPAVALGVCLEQNGKHEQANAQLLKASKLAPSLFQ